MSYKFKYILMLIFISLHVITLSSCSAGESGAGIADTTVYADEDNDNKSTQEAGKRLSSYSTEFSEWVKARNHNIALAAKAIDGTVINQGETFSYNETVGPTISSKGYKKARTFFRGRETKGVGGGVCQVSSTLYNAALQAGMEIVERHPHTRKVEYVPEGLDAATSYGGIDLKFKNNYDSPVVIKAVTDKNSVEISLFMQTV